MNEKPWLLAARISVSVVTKEQPAPYGLGALAVGLGTMMKGTSHQLGTLHRNHFWSAIPRAIKKGASESAKKVGAELISLSDGAFVPRPGVARARANVVFLIQRQSSKKRGAPN